MGLREEWRRRLLLSVPRDCLLRFSSNEVSEVYEIDLDLECLLLLSSMPFPREALRFLCALRIRPPPTSSRETPCRALRLVGSEVYDNEVLLSRLRFRSIPIFDSA